MSLEVSGLHRNVRLASGEHRPVFGPLSLSLPPGETVFVTGRSGVGKSLLLRTVAGLDAAQAGSVRLAGDPQGPRFAQGGGLPAWRCRVAYASQGRWPFAATPTETLADFASFAAQQAWALVAGPPLELQPLACALGLEPAVLGQRWATLSGGQAARAQLAVTLALRPRVLLLDEPTAALDEASSLLVEAALRACPASKLWVSHSAEQVARVGGAVLRLSPPGEEEA